MDKSDGNAKSVACQAITRKEDAKPTIKNCLLIFRRQRPTRTNRLEEKEVNRGKQGEYKNLSTHCGRLRTMVTTVDGVKIWPTMMEKMRHDECRRGKEFTEKIVSGIKWGIDGQAINRRSDI